ncbi:ATP-dependent RNA helicase bel-like, partial [Rhipicephalus sanguineus]|uniref:ATP-dependent RNA helicase bel-like n=1 Tax=Rhipicephalus sanguineus TaxID=34632 RepID=UPI0018933751
MINESNQNGKGLEQQFAGLDLNSGAQGNKTGPSRYVPPHLRNNRSVLPGPPQGNAQGYAQKSTLSRREVTTGEQGTASGVTVEVAVPISQIWRPHKRNDGPVRNNAFPPRHEYSISSAVTKA